MSRPFAMLRHRHIATLWLGQLLSSSGDYFYSIAVTWIAARQEGGAAGLVVAAQSGAALGAGFVTTAFIDRWNRRRAMLVADVLRALVVGTLPLLARAGKLDVPHLVAVALVVGSLDALFVPALQASVPSLVTHPGDLSATNALMDSTRRIARAVGPSLAGLVAAHVTTPTFFAVDAVSFLASAGTLLAMDRRWNDAFAPEPRAVSSRSPATSARRASWRERVVRGPARASLAASLGHLARELGEAFRMVRAHAAASWAIGSVFVVNVVWCSGFFVGAALFASRVLGTEVSGYGFIIGAYGFGNVVGNLVCGLFPARRRILAVFVAKLVLGVGFGLLAVAPSLPLAMLAAAIAAFGGPLGDLALLSLLQTEFAPRHRGRVFALRHMGEQAGVMLGFLGSGPLFLALSVRAGIGLTAVVLVLTGLAGLLRFGAREATVAT